MVYTYPYYREANLDDLYDWIGLLKEGHDCVSQKANDHLADDDLKVALGLITTFDNNFSEREN